MLADLSTYPRWNPFIVEASGPLEVGAALRVKIKPPGRRATSFSPIVSAAEPGRLLEWKGKLGVRGLFDGTHRFELRPTESGTLFVQSETITGILVKPLERMLRDTEAGFELMNRALASRAARG